MRNCHDFCLQSQVKNRKVKEAAGTGEESQENTVKMKSQVKIILLNFN